MSKIFHIFFVSFCSFTIISIFLPSSSLFGQETGTLYPWETSSGIIWKSFGDARFLPEYKGEILNGKPNGVGILYNGNPNWSRNYLIFSFTPRSMYIGEWKNGNWEGQGSYIHFDGSKRLGIFKQGKDWETTWYGSHGNNIRTFFKGRIVLKKSYNGTLFSQRGGGLFNWFQTSNNFTDGKYEGEIKNGTPNGIGKLIFKNGDHYEGNWIEGKLKGQGNFSSHDGTKYLGEWMNGKYHGKGKLIFSDGVQKVGEFKDGSDWNTKWYNPKGKIVGEYSNGILQQ